MSHLETIPAQLFLQADMQPDFPAYYTHSPEGWQATTWKQYAAHVSQAGRALISLGVAPGQCLSIMGNHRPEAAVFALAAMSIGGAFSGLYGNIFGEDLQSIIHHAESPLILVESEEQWYEVHSMRPELPLLRQIVLMPGVDVDDPLSLTWDAFLATGDATRPQEFERRLDKLVPEQIATFSYSIDIDNDYGPLGIMLSHANLSWTAATLVEVLQVTPNDTGFSSLPIAHITEQLFNIHMPIWAGNSVYYARSLEDSLEDLAQARPTLFATVAPLWKQLQSEAERFLAQQSDRKAKITWARKQAQKVHQRYNSGELPGFFLQLKLALARKLALQEIKSHLGLDRLRFATASRSLLPPEQLEFFGSLDLPVFGMFGVEECSGVALLNIPGDAKPGSLGKPLPGIDAQIAQDHTLQICGPNLFLGYFKNNRATSQRLKYGWLQGDKPVKLDDEGYVYWSDEAHPVS